MPETGGEIYADDYQELQLWEQVSQQCELFLFISSKRIVKHKSKEVLFFNPVFKKAPTLV